MIDYKKISPNRSSPRNHKIDRITPHCYVGQVTVQDMAAWLCSPSAKASANYGIGKDGSVGLFVEEGDRSWCSSSAENDNRAITIECASDRSYPYTINDAVYYKLLDLMEDICRRYGKKKLLWFGDKEKTLNYNPADDEMLLSVHRWFANKECPGEYIYTRLPQIAAEVTKRLSGAVLEVYRVRISWDSPESQIGAFSDVNNAIAFVNTKPGYSVFDSKGKAVYTSANQEVYTPQEWIKMIAPIAQDMARTYAILPSVLIAQTALESGWGSRELARYYNILGMKSDLINSTWISKWDGATKVVVTTEYYNGKKVNVEDVFRVYHTFRECIEDYCTFLLNVRNSKGYKYRRIQGLTNPEEVINLIRIGTGTDTDPEGYFTDPNYCTKIMRIIKENDLTQYDDAMPDHTSPATPVYRVQVGAYKRKANAVVRANSIKKKTDLDCFIEESDLFRVFCGSFKEKKNAELREKLLNSKNIKKTTIVGGGDA